MFDAMGEKRANRFAGTFVADRNGSLRINPYSDLARRLSGADRPAASPEGTKVVEVEGFPYGPAFGAVFLVLFYFLAIVLLIKATYYDYHTTTWEYVVALSAYAPIFLLAATPIAFGLFVGLMTALEWLNIPKIWRKAPSISRNGIVSDDLLKLRQSQTAHRKGVVHIR